MIKAEEVYKIGRLGKAHGVKGEVSFQFDDDIFDRVDADYLVLDIDGILVPFFMEGRSNIRSVMIDSMMERSPRAPSL